MRVNKPMAGWLLAALVLGAPVQLAAQAAPPLPAQLQALLDKLPATERERLLRRQRRVAALDDAQRAALQARVAEWDALAREEQAQRREAWEAWQGLPVDERARMRQARAQFEAMDEDSRLALRQHFEALDAGIRRGWLLGPSLGADWPRLHGLFAQVPDDQRHGLLVALRALPPEARADLALLASRAPPEARDGLRRELLALQPDARVRWLRRLASE